MSLVALLLTTLALGCGGGSTGGPKAGAGKEYDVKGKVMAVDPNKPAVTLDHEDIPGLMKGMEMEFSVEDPKVLDGLKLGDSVSGRLRKGETGYVITHLEKR
jgi:Cu/Ag efflux protein CusF